jgi:hypothetical protein
MAYRFDDVSTGAAQDTVRPAYAGTGNTDYIIGYTAATEWENYTRTYPAGVYNVFMRGARGAGGNGDMGLAHITSGWGTSNQTAVSLGRFTIPNTGGWQTFGWVPLKDASGNLVNVTLGGSTNTLRLTDGGANVNFLLLAPAVALQATHAGANLTLSFGTQTGFSYTVLYKNQLTDPVWTPLSTVAGDGTIKTVTETTSLPGRYYRLSVH